MTRFTRMLVLGLALVTSVCVSAVAIARDQESSTNAATAGGVYRLATTDFGFTNAFDPTGEYLGVAWGLYDNLLLRGALTYRHTAGAAGNQLVPDIATALPTSSDGKTWTVTLKPGVRFGPPVNREITSKDFVYAFERIGTASLAAQYGFYFFDIAGFPEFQEGLAPTISGITTPDDRTLVIRLTRAVGDFPSRLAMPATFPIPREVGQCFTQPGEYGRFLIASGPYMLEGSGALDISSCAAMRSVPISGFDPNRRMSLIRNPNYDPTTDSPTVREALPDRFVMDVIPDLNTIFSKIAAGELEGSPDRPPNAVVARYLSDPALTGRLKRNAADRTWYLSMNLTQAPFDDVHVRKAVNLIMDKAALGRAWGAPISGTVARHIVPDSTYLTGVFSPPRYDPYRTAGDAGSLAKAKAQMRLSKYDTNKDGICDVPACRNISHVTRNISPWPPMNRVLTRSLGKIGLRVRTRALPTGPAYATIQDVSRKVALASNAGWGKDYADPGTFIEPLFSGASIIPRGNINYSLVGLTRARAKQLRIAPAGAWPPSVDADIARCVPLRDPIRRNACWVALDKKLMERVVPWVPYLAANSIEIIGPAVSQHDYDQSSNMTALAHVAVDTTVQR